MLGDFILYDISRIEELTMTVNQWSLGVQGMENEGADGGLHNIMIILEP